jgi:hypothetical protein
LRKPNDLNHDEGIESIESVRQASVLLSAEFDAAQLEAIQAAHPAVIGYGEEGGYALEPPSGVDARETTYARYRPDIDVDAILKHVEVIIACRLAGDVPHARRGEAPPYEANRVLDKCWPGSTDRRARSRPRIGERAGSPVPASTSSSRSPLPEDGLLWHMPNVFLLPHQGSDSLRYLDRGVDLIRETCAATSRALRY